MLSWDINEFEQWVFLLNINRKKGNYNPNLVWFIRIQKKYLSEIVPQIVWRSGRHYQIIYLFYSYPNQNKYIDMHNYIKHDCECVEIRTNFKSIYFYTFHMIWLETLTNKPSKGCSISVNIAYILYEIIYSINRSHANRST